MDPLVFGLVTWMYLGLPCHGKAISLLHIIIIPIFSFSITSYLQFNNSSLGDAVAHTAGVISDPEFTEKELDPASDRVIVVATDGLWEFVDNDETIALMGGTPGPAEAVDCLVKEANQRWMREEQVIDDTTIIVAHLFDYKTSED